MKAKNVLKKVGKFAKKGALAVMHRVPQAAAGAAMYAGSMAARAYGSALGYRVRSGANSARAAYNVYKGAKFAGKAVYHTGKAAYRVGKYASRSAPRRGAMMSKRIGSSRKSVSRARGYSTYKRKR